MYMYICMHACMCIYIYIYGLDENIYFEAYVHINMYKTYVHLLKHFRATAYGFDDNMY